jgi:hypothetical protein
MIIKKETKNSIIIYYVDKDYDDKKMEKILHTKLKSNNNFFIINEDADVYTKDNKLLLRYRKNKLNKKNIDEFYDNVIKFALTKTTTRGIASGSKKMKMNIKNNPKVMTNIIGYMDTMSPKLKFAFKVRGIQNNFSVRPSYFMLMYPDKFKKLLPFISILWSLVTASIKPITSAGEMNSFESGVIPFTGSSIPRTIFCSDVGDICCNKYLYSSNFMVLGFKNIIPNTSLFIVL